MGAEVAVGSVKSGGSSGGVWKAGCDAAHSACAACVLASLPHVAWGSLGGGGGCARSPASYTSPLLFAVGGLHTGLGCRRLLLVGLCRGCVSGQHVLGEERREAFFGVSVCLCTRLDIGGGRGWRPPAVTAAAGRVGLVGSLRCV